jgi:hypothetical protein
VRAIAPAIRRGDSLGCPPNVLSPLAPLCTGEAGEGEPLRYLDSVGEGNPFGDDCSPSSGRRTPLGKLAQLVQQISVEPLK